MGMNRSSIRTVLLVLIGLLSAPLVGQEKKSPKKAPAPEMQMLPPGDGETAEPVGAYIEAPSNPTTVVVGQSISFRGSSDFGNVYTWSFGDGTTGNGYSVTKSFAATGTYTVRLTVRRSPLSPYYTNSLTTTTVTVISPAPPAISSFVASPSSILQGQSSTLSWAATGATSLSISGIGGVGGSSIGVAPVNSTAYRLTASNAYGTVTADATVTVNHVPVIGATLSNRTFPAQLPMDITLAAASDSDGDGVSYSLSGLPAGLYFNAGTRRITGTPNAVATYPTAYPITYSVSDGRGGVATQWATYYVDVPPPSINSFVASPSTVVQGSASTLSWAASYVSSAYGGSYSIQNQSTGGVTALGLATSTAMAPSAATSYVLTVANRSGSATASLAVQVNRPPTWASTFSGQSWPGLTAVNQTLPAATDADGEAITYSLSGSLPAGLSFDAANHRIIGTLTTQLYPRSFAVTYTAMDARGASITQSMTFTVQVPLPVITSFTASPTLVVSGQTTLLRWTAQHVSNATGGEYFVTEETPASLRAKIALDPGDGDPADPEPSTSATATPTKSTIYVLTATNGSGTATARITVTVNRPPTWSGTLGTRTWPGLTAVNFTLPAATDPDGDALTYALAGSLPTGLSFNASTHQVTGTLAALGAYPSTFPVTYTVTDTRGAVITQSGNLVVDVPSPVISSLVASPATVVQGSASTLSWAAAYVDGVYGGSYSIRNQSTGVVTGLGLSTSTLMAPTVATTYELTAANRSGSTTAIVTVLVNRPPTWASTLPGQSWPGLTAVNQTLPAATDPDGEAITYSLSGSLPAGLSFDAANRRIIGTLTTQLYPRSFAVTYAATDSRGASITQSMTFTVQVPLPVITSFTASPTLVVSGQTSLLRWTAQHVSNATGGEYSITEETPASLRAKIAMNPGDGDPADPEPSTSATATPTQSTTYVLTATNGSGSATARITVTVNKAPTWSGTVINQTWPALTGVSFTLPVATDPDGDALTYSLSGALPSGLGFNASTRQITGTPGALGTYPTTFPVTYTVTDARGAVTTQLANFVVDVPKPVISSFAASPTTLVLGSASTLTWASSNVSSADGGSYSVQNQSTGVITGLALSTSTSISPLAATTYVLTATNRSGSATANVTVQVNKPPTWVSTPSGQSWPGLTAVNLTLPAATDPDGDALSYAIIGALPAGLAFNPATRQVTGTLASQVYPASFPISYQATDARGALITQPITFTVAVPLPVISAFSASASGVPAGTTISILAGQPVSFTWAAQYVSLGTGGTYALGEEALVALRATLIPIDGGDGGGGGGTPTEPGTSATASPTKTTRYTLTARNSSGSTTAQVTVYVNRPPVLSTPLAAQTFTTNTAQSFTLPAATDADGDALTYEVAFSNAGLTFTFDPTTRVFQGVSNQVGTYPVTYTVRDGKGGVATQTVNFITTLPTAAPAIAAFSANAARLSPGNDGTLTWQVTGPLSLLYVEVVGGGIVQTSLPATGTRQVTPSANSLDGLTVTYRLVARNLKGDSTATATVALNRAPLIGAWALPTLRVNNYAVIDLPTLSDPDGDAMAMPVLSGLPAGLVFDTAARKISGIPTSAGGPTLTLSVTDQPPSPATPMTASQSFSWPVQGMNDTTTPAPTPSLPANDTVFKKARFSEMIGYAGSETGLITSVDVNRQLQENIAGLATGRDRATRSTYNYGYDPMGQLVKAEGSFVNPTGTSIFTDHTAYAYDAHGNRKTHTVATYDADPTKAKGAIWTYQYKTGTNQLLRTDGGTFKGATSGQAAAGDGFAYTADGAASEIWRNGKLQKLIYDDPRFMRLPTRMEKDAEDGRRVESDLRYDMSGTRVFKRDLVKQGADLISDRETYYLANGTEVLMEVEQRAGKLWQGSSNATLTAGAGGWGERYYTIPCQAGDVFSGEAYARTVGMSTGNAILGVRFDSDTQVVGWASSGVTNSTSSVLLTTTGVAPAGTTKALIFINVGPCPVGAQGLFEGIRFWKGGAAALSADRYTAYIFGAGSRMARISWDEDGQAVRPLTLLNPAFEATAPGGVLGGWVASASAGSVAQVFTDNALNTTQGQVLSLTKGSGTGYVEQPLGTFAINDKVEVSAKVRSETGVASGQLQLVRVADDAVLAQSPASAPTAWTGLRAQLKLSVAADLKLRLLVPDVDGPKVYFDEVSVRSLPAAATVNGSPNLWPDPGFESVLGQAGPGGSVSASAGVTVADGLSGSTREGLHQLSLLAAGVYTRTIAGLDPSRTYLFSCWQKVGGTWTRFIDRSQPNPQGNLAVTISAPAGSPMLVDQAELVLDTGTTLPESWIPENRLGRVDWFVTDHLGSTKLMVDAFGQHRFTGDDDPFGINLRSFGDKDTHRYTGQILDEEQVLYYYGARYYLPEIGRFLSGDPKALSAPAWSPYHYVYNIPIIARDPDGELPNFVIGAMLGVIVEYGAQVGSNYIDGKGLSSFYKIDVADLAVAGLEGAVTSGASSIKRLGVRVAFKAGTAVVAGSVKRSFHADASKGDQVVELSMTLEKNSLQASTIDLTFGVGGAMADEGLKKAAQKLSGIKERLAKHTKRASRASSGSSARRVAAERATQAKEALEKVEPPKSIAVPLNITTSIASDQANKAQDKQ